MNALRRTITAIVILSLLISGPGLAQNAAEREAREALLKEPDAAPKEAQRSANMRQKSESSAHYHNGVKVRPVAGSATPPSPPQPPVRPGLGTVLGSSRSRWPLRSGGAASVLVIPSAEIETKDLLAIHEDLNVMSRIFEKKLQEDAHITPAGARLFLDSSHYALIAPLQQVNLCISVCP